MDNTWLKSKEPEKIINNKSIKNTRKDDVYLKPFIKWAGGKGQLLNKIKEQYPKELGDTITKYAEPFIGGGAVLFDILQNYDLEEIYIGDINTSLINTYKSIRDNVNDVIKLLKIMEMEYIPLEKEKRKLYYYEKRDIFNKLKVEDISTNNIEKASIFIFLNKTCFNGLYRVNKKGLFNVPMGDYKNPTICNENNLKSVSKALQNVNIVCGDYKQCELFVDNKTLVYFAPPYRPLTGTSNFKSYNESDFNDQQQIELANFINLLDKRGVSIISSNSDPKNVDENDNFFDDLYKNQKIFRVSASRMINSKSKSRGKINEILITNI